MIIRYISVKNNSAVKKVRRVLYLNMESEVINMNKKTVSTMTGVAVAMAAGTAAYLAAENKNKISAKKLKKTANKAIKAVEATVKDISQMIM